MRIVFCGTPESALPSLRALAGASRREIVAVLTQPDRPQGRGRHAEPAPVRRLAEELGFPVLAPEKPKHVRSELEALHPDVVVVVAYGHILRPWFLELPPLGCINVHFSILPRHRGVAPVAWAILAGDRETGVSTMRLDEGVDTGPVYLTERIPVGEDDTTGTLTQRLAGRGAELLLRTLDGIEAGTLSPAPQDDALATYARKLEKDDGRIDWTRPAEEIARRVRGLSPWPGTFTGWRGRVLKVHRARPLPGELAPGALQRVGGRVVAGTGSGVLELVEVQPEGKSRMEGEAWWRGARPANGEKLGPAA
jgi:methionyl-tRNA formyltransferase